MRGLLKAPATVNLLQHYLSRERLEGQGVLDRVTDQEYGVPRVLTADDVGRPLLDTRTGPPYTSAALS